MAQLETWESLFTPPLTIYKTSSGISRVMVVQQLMRLIGGLRRQQGQREVYINSPAPTHTSLGTLNIFLLSANNSN